VDPLLENLISFIYDLSPHLPWLHVMFKNPKSKILLMHVLQRVLVSVFRNPKSLNTLANHSWDISHTARLEKHCRNRHITLHRSYVHSTTNNGYQLVYILCRGIFQDSRGASNSKNFHRFTYWSLLFKSGQNYYGIQQNEVQLYKNKMITILHDTTKPMRSMTKNDIFW